MPTPETIHDYLRVLVEQKASDLHLKVGAAPILRINGHLHPLDFPKLGPNDTERAAFERFRFSVACIRLRGRRGIFAAFAASPSSRRTRTSATAPAASASRASAPKR